MPVSVSGSSSSLAIPVCGAYSVDGRRSRSLHGHGVLYCYHAASTSGHRVLCTHVRYKDPMDVVSTCIPSTSTARGLDAMDTAPPRPVPSLITNGELQDDSHLPPDVLTSILRNLIICNNPTTSLKNLEAFGAVNSFAREHLRSNANEMAKDLLSVDMGMSPSALATMIRQMSPSHRASLVSLAEMWETTRDIRPLAFLNCTVLELPQLPPVVAHINCNSFCQCTSLKLNGWNAKVLEYIGTYAFQFCTSLTLENWITPVLVKIFGRAFDGCTNLTLTGWNAPMLGLISYNCFANCTSLTLSDWKTPRLQIVDDASFQNCASLVLSNWKSPMLRMIGCNAFAGCTALELPSGLEGIPNNLQIMDGAFHGCTKLSELAKTQIKAINPSALDPA